MKLPRWTVYPALGLLAAMLVLAFPHPQADRHRGAAQRSRRAPAAAETPRVAPQPAPEPNRRDEANPTAEEPRGPESD